MRLNDSLLSINSKIGDQQNERRENENRSLNLEILNHRVVYFWTLNSLNYKVLSVWCFLFISWVTVIIIYNLLVSINY